MPRYCPVVKEDLSEQSQRTASATSIGFPKRPRGCSESIRLLTAGSPKARSAIGVSMTAGQNGVHANAVRGIFDCRRFRKAANAVLARDVDAGSRRSN